MNSTQHDEAGRRNRGRRSVHRRPGRLCRRAEATTEAATARTSPSPGGTTPPRDPLPGRLGRSRRRVRGGQPRRHGRADRLPERRAAAHADPERTRGRRPAGPLPGVAGRRAARSGRERLPHAARRRDPRHDRERRRDGQPLAGRRRHVRRSRSPSASRASGTTRTCSTRPASRGARDASTSWIDVGRRSARGRLHADRRRRGRRLARRALVVPVRAQVVLARDAGRRPRPTSTSATRAGSRPASSCEEFIGTEPFQEGFLGTPAQQGAGQLGRSRRERQGGDGAHGPLERRRHRRPDRRRAGARRSSAGSRSRVSPARTATRRPPSAAVTDSACSADAPPECADLLAYIMSEDVQKRFAASGSGIPTVPAPRCRRSRTRTS